MPSWRNRAFRTAAALPARGGASSRDDAPERILQPRRAEEEVPVEQSVVEKAVYCNGHRVEAPKSLREAMHRLHGPDKPMAWIGLFHPTETQINDMAEVFNLHPLAVEDAIVAHQRPKLERYDETLFVVLRPAIYLDASETVQIGELHLFIGPDFVLTVRHSDRPKLAAVRERLESDPELLARGPEAVLYAMIDFVVDRYAPVVAGLENDIDEIENQVFESDPAVSRRIYELSREVAELQRATKPLLQIMKGLEAGFDKYGTDEELQRNLRDVADHATSVVERVDGFRANLADILTLNATLVAQTQNEEMRRLAEAGMEQSDEVKKISAWAAILFAPSLISGIYGMNFDEMPELHWAFGYPFAVVLMLVVCCLLFVVFRKRKWL
ncbi:magnesium transport protein CorA [Flexivirga endophytica]|uniref:Magnesium transport protein CorA n=1 Tax=Flexivirga endophytica TaxID=1849103 RepID=A0A916SZZ7_9MICO|nr:magnesium transport protein CorA [Flexivirga endophytica]GHB54427.1 magnesium transport protein CorA [Flexivirga endophytica]